VSETTYRFLSVATEPAIRTSGRNTSSTISSTTARGTGFKVVILLDKTGRKRRERMATSTGSDLERNLFESANDVRTFFETTGFQTEEYSYMEIVPHLSSMKNLNLTPEDTQSALELIALAKTLVLTPAKQIP